MWMSSSAACSGSLPLAISSATASRPLTICSASAAEISPTAASMRACAWLPRTSSRSSRRSKSMLAFRAAAAGSMAPENRAPRPPPPLSSLGS